MTTTTVPVSAATSAAVRVTNSRVVAAEWIKFRGTRSAWWLVGGSVASIVAAGVSPALTLALGGPTTDDVGADPTAGALAGVSFTQLLVGALGVLVVGGEYTSGLIRTSLVAVPGRLPVLWAKVLVATAVTLAASLAAVAVAAVTARGVLSSAGVPIPPLGADGLRALVGAAVFLALTAALGAGFGWLVRSTAGGLTALFAFLFVLPLVGLLIPSITAYLPTNAGTAVMQVGPATGSVSPWLGLGIYVAYTAVVLAVAAALLRRRDA